MKPTTRAEALKSPDSAKWIQAMNEEYQSLTKNETWTLTDLPTDKKAIGCRWVFKVKTDETGKPIRQAQGFRKQWGIDFHETFSPVLSTTSLRMILSIGASENLEIHQMDVETAYLNGNIDEEVYMCQPEGFETGRNSQKVCRLRKAIYGLKQSGRAWWITFSEFLKDQRFQRLLGDPCIFQLKRG